MDGNGSKKIHPAWMALIIFIGSHIIVISGFSITNNTKTNRNQEDIKELREDQKELSKMIFNELKEIREEIKNGH